MKKLLLTLLGALIAIPTFARNFDYSYEGNVLRFTVLDEYDKTVEMIYSGFNMVAGDLTIPEIVNDGNNYYTVVSIGERTFHDYSYLTSVTIPNSITSIGRSAFSNCSGLTSATIGNSVTSIGDWAFYNCSGLTSISIGNSVTSIGERAFYNCSDLTSISIGDSVTSIGDSAFYGCSGLTSISIPNSVTTIGGNAFYGCSDLTSATIGDSITYINQSIFSGCTSLKSVILGKSVKSVSNNAFEECNNLIRSAYPNTISNPFPTGKAIIYNPNEVIIEDGIIYSADKKGLLFASAGFKGEYIIPSFVTSIGNYAFQLCNELTSILLPDALTSIGYFAFCHCSSLASVSIPNSVTTIGDWAFSNCTNLTSASIGNSVTSIGESAFYECSSLTSISIGNSVTSIGNDAFYNCSGMTSVLIPNSVTSIGYSAFNNCSGLTSVSIGNSVTSIGNSAFYNCSKLKSIVIPASVTSIGNNAFGGCSGLTSATIIGNSLTSIDSFIFSNCTSLKSIIIGRSVKTVSNNAFQNCKSLIKSAYPNSISNPFPTGKAIEYNPDEVIIEDGIIFNADKKRILFASAGLTGAYTIPSFVTSIGNEAFYNCSGLTSVSIGNSVTSIGDYAFYDCSKLISITIPNSVTSIGNYAFSGCSAISDVNVAWDIPLTIDKYWFSESIYKTACLSIPELSVFNYITTGWWNLFKNRKVGYYDIKQYSDGVFNYQLITNPDNPQAILVQGNYSALTEANIPERFTDLSDESNPIRYYVTAIAPEAFKNNTNLKTVKFNSRSKIRNICESAFRGCNGLTSINIPDSVTSIGNYAFSGCSGLTSVTIPNSVTSIDNHAFSGCSGLTKAEFASIESLCRINFGNSEANPLSSAHNLYIAGDEIKDLVIPETIKSIGGNTFYGCSGLTSATIPNSVTSIGESAFAFTGLTDLRIEDEFERLYLDNSAFDSATIKNIYLGRPMSYIPGSYYIETAVVGNLVENIPASSFIERSKLKSLTLGSGLKSIEEKAFSGCTSLTEVIIPPSVETIGASAFAYNSALASIIMGHSVQTIGAKAFDRCPAQTVRITAQTPPTAPNNTFSTYSGKLYLQGEEAYDAYYDAYTCWDRFDSYLMIEPTGIKSDSDTKINGNPGDTFQLTATLMPENVTLPQIFWRSTNPAIATVDGNGLVTLHADLNEVMTLASDEEENGRCKIIAESLYTNGPVLEFEVTSDSSGIEDVVADEEGDNGTIDFTSPIEVYNLNGRFIATSLDNLSTGIYIVRQGNIVKKIAVR